LLDVEAVVVVCLLIVKDVLVAHPTALLLTAVGDGGHVM